MASIPVKPYPFEREYDSFEAAIKGAKNHPLQKQAQSDGQQLTGTSIIDGYWTNRDCVIRFSNERWLHVFTQDGFVRWAIADSLPSTNLPQLDSIGAAPIVLDWGGTIGESPFDRLAIIANRRGAMFSQLWINEGGLLLYTHGQSELWFHAVYRTDTNEDLLFAFEDS